MAKPDYFIGNALVYGRLSVGTPVGELLVQASADGIVSVLPVEYVSEQTGPGLPENMDLLAQQKIAGHLSQVREELEAYFCGELFRFNVALDLRGTEFQRQVWAELQRIGYGERCSYQDIAERINRPKAVRAVGSANGANPVAIIVPCHRVVAKNGALAGYAYGVGMKQYLLDLERGRRREAV